MLELPEEAWSSCRRRRKGRKDNAWTFLSENATFQFYVLNSARETFEEIQLFESFNNVTSSHKIGSLPCRKVQPCANAEERTVSVPSVCTPEKPHVTSVALVQGFYILQKVQFVVC